MEGWTILAGVAVAWVAQWLRGKTTIPTAVSYVVIIAFGFVLFLLGYEGVIAFNRAFVVEGLMWVAALFGIGRVAADAKVAPKTNTI